MTRPRHRERGSIYRRMRDGRWVASVSFGHDKDGNRIRDVRYARTKKEAMEVRGTLIRALSRGPAGNLRFGKKEVVKATEGFEFLGYDLRVVRGNAAATPTDDNQQSVFDKFIGHMTRRRYDEARRCVTRWISSQTR